MSLRRATTIAANVTNPKAVTRGTVRRAQGPAEKRTLASSNCLSEGQYKARPSTSAARAHRPAGMLPCCIRPAPSSLGAFVPSMDCNTAAARWRLLAFFRSETAVIVSYSATEQARRSQPSCSVGRHPARIAPFTTFHECRTCRRARTMKHKAGRHKVRPEERKGST